MEQTLGKRIMHNRKRLGLTQDQLAEKLGVTAQAVSKWENDQSCPDISMLPQLAEIFGISTDELLGRPQQAPIHEAEIVNEADEAEPNGVHFQNGNFEFTWDGGRKNSLGFAVLVLLVGALYFLSEILVWDLSFWDILWPSSLLVFGIFGLYPRFSFFRLACTILGGFFLAEKLLPLPVETDGNIIFAAIVIVFGLSLLAEALRKPKKPHFHIGRGDSGQKEKQQLDMDENSFSYTASFGSCTQLIEVPQLSSGLVHTSFGEYVLDLSGVETVNANCSIEAHCSFGSLKLLTPSRYTLKQNNSTAFAEISTTGHPDSTPEGIIHLEGHVSFGEIEIEYV